MEKIISKEVREAVIESMRFISQVKEVNRRHMDSYFDRAEEILNKPKLNTVQEKVRARLIDAGWSDANGIMNNVMDALNDVVECPEETAIGMAIDYRAHNGGIRESLAQVLQNIRAGKYE